jgi:hypothetical protein
MRKKETKTRVDYRRIVRMTQVGISSMRNALVKWFTFSYDEHSGRFQPPPVLRRTGFES